MEKVLPRCTGCDELIFEKKYTRARNVDWHSDHVFCFGCDCQLISTEYMAVREGEASDRVYCNDCYALK